MNPFSLPLTRRAFLQRSGVGFGMLGLAGLLGQSRALFGDEPAARGPHFAPKAKRIIHFFLNGGPSHVDTFDPKPALTKYTGQALPKTFITERKTGAAFASPFKFEKYGHSGMGGSR